jgi:hypothetical protein
MVQQLETEVCHRCNQSIEIEEQIKYGNYLSRFIPMCRAQPVDRNAMRGVKVLLQYIWFSSLCNRKETEDRTTMIVYHDYCHWFP